MFILDPWWNPAIEAQAVDRAYRIGQKNTVHTYKFIARNTVEEKILKYLTIIPAFGSPLSWTAMHRYHHMYSGSKQDNESPERIGYIRA